MRSIFTTCLAVLFVFCSLHGISQTNPVPQNIPFAFNGQTGGTLPAGMAIHRFGTTTAAIPTTRTLIPGNGDLPYLTTSNAGGWNDQGSNGIGILASSSQSAGALIVSVNTTGLSNILVNWTARTILQQASRDNSISLQYRVGNTGNFIDIGTTTTYTSAGKTAGDFASFMEVLPAAAENKTEVQIRWLYWESSVGLTGSRDRIAVDDISITLGCTPPSNQPTGLSFTKNLTSITGSFTAATPGTIAADAYLVLISTSPTLTDQPGSGTAYAVDDVIGNATVVSINNNTSFTASNLTPGTTYYFTVYSYSSAQTCYLLPAPLTGNIPTDASPACTPPTQAASNLTATNITGSSMTLNYNRGNGDNILIIARPNSAVTQGPFNGVNYTTGSQIGSGNTVIYNGPAASFDYTGLLQNTNYYFALYEYGLPDYCYNASPLLGNFTTSCISAVDVSSLNGQSGNGSASISWTNPTASCFDQILVVVSNAPITGAGSSYTGTPSTVYTGPDQVVFRGIGTTVSVTGLVNGTTYYFKVFTRNGATYSAGVQITINPFDPATGFQYLYGNLHSHSSYSDGNKEDVTKKPIDDFTFARDAECLDFLGISEHNHSGAGMNVANFPLGYNDANTINGVTSPTTGNSIVTLYGMEWGVISGGGHVVVYGFNDQLIGWEPNNYNIFCQKGDYATLFSLVNGQPNSFATLAHPNSTDYSNISNTPYNVAADNAIFGTAIESGPAFSTNISYSDYPASLSYLSYYKKMLALGYHLGAQMDGDNHYLTFGRQSRNRMVVLSASKTRQDLVSAIRAMRFYASNDCNVKIDYKCYTGLMGSSQVHTGLPVITLDVTDPDAGDVVNTIELWGGPSGSTTTSALIKTFTGFSSVVFTNTDPANVQPDNTTYYYFTITTQADGNKIVSSPVWYTRSDGPLPVTLVQFTGSYNAASKTTLLHWATAQEFNSKSFVIERSDDNGRTFNAIGEINAAGTSNTSKQYQYPDPNPAAGTHLYRLQELNIDNTYSYSTVVSVTNGDKNLNYYSVYPNPAHQFTYVNSTSSSTIPVTIQVVDVAGRVISEQVNPIDNNHPVKVSLDKATQGVYMIKIAGQEGNSIERIIVR